ncbi:sulfurtransferase [Massilia violaceinigra]|uniref:Sulfurtransferase n=1 Tax=Massilia violaceinigra TaxID=2045208 RepID=A0ABY4A6X6_9BURK|nr:rhodanese-like domain-containing protein [Massilia violaceinigra]UOD29895.1 sulfurtransferase [Massilia violaceinigra]
MPAARRALARARALVAPGELAGLLRDPALRLLEAGCAGAAAFEQAHIDGAGYLDTRELEAAPLFNKVDDAALLRVLLAHGVRHDTTVVVYSRNPLAAARAAHLMLYAGVTDVRMLDGGFAAWCAAGLPGVAGPAAAALAATDFGAPFPGRPDYLTGMAQARALLARPDAALVSIRTWNEYTGATSGYSYIEARGEIPGALWGRAGREGDVNSMSHFQHPDGRMLDGAAIEALWRAGGIHRASHNAFYCGTGWRASLAFFYAWVMGWERISVYDGGWYEWSTDPGNPVAINPAPPPRCGTPVPSGLAPSAPHPSPTSA